MWAVSSVPPRPFVPLILKPAKPFLLLTFSANGGQPRRSRSYQIPKQQQNLQEDNQEKLKQEDPKQQGSGGTKQLSGSDVLWAIQRAAAEKSRLRGGAGGAKKKKKKVELDSARSQREEDLVDYSNVRPLCVKSEWGVRLDDLDKRLQKLSETK